MSWGPAEPEIDNPRIRIRVRSRAGHEDRPIVHFIELIAADVTGLAARRHSQIPAILFRRMALHWLTIFAGFIAVVVITTTHGVDGRLAGQLMTLIFGIVYFLGGLHLDGRFLWPGVVAMVGSAAVDHLGPYSWTIVGVVITVTLVASALWTKGSHAQAPTQN